MRSLIALFALLFYALSQSAFESSFRKMGGTGLAQMDAPNGSFIAYAIAPGKTVAAETERQQQGEVSRSVTSYSSGTMPDMAKILGCTECHAIDKRVVGPAWMDVSKFYNGKMYKSYGGKTLNEATGGKNPQDWLLLKISKGGSGNWGSAVMIANDPGGVKQDKIKALIQFILGLAK